MTVVNVETGEIVTSTEVRTSVEVARTRLEQAAEQIIWQIENQVWTVLGYQTWDEMRDAEYGGAAVIVPRADRPQLVARLRSSGLSQQEIGDTLGVSQRTVSGDVSNSANDDEPAPETRVDSLGRTQPTTKPRLPQVDSPEPPEPDPADAALDNWVESGEALQLSRWRTNFMKAIARAGQLTLFTPADVAEKADSELISELVLLGKDLDNYTQRVLARRPRPLHSIGGES